MSYEKQNQSGIAAQVIKPQQHYIRKWFFCVLSKHSDHDIGNNAKLSLIRCSQIDEDVFGIEGNFGVLRVDYRRHRENLLSGVVNDRIDRRIANDMQIAGKMFIGLWKEVHI